MKRIYRLLSWVCGGASVRIVRSRPAACALIAVMLLACGKPEEASTVTTPDGPNAAEGVFAHGYVRDAAKFKAEDASGLDADEKAAIEIAKKRLAIKIGVEARGKFTVAPADWGWQVDFSGLEKKEARGWKAMDEGFGEVYLDRAKSKIEIDLGP